MYLYAISTTCKTFEPSKTMYLIKERNTKHATHPDDPFQASRVQQMV